MRLLDIVRKLNGEIEPIGETNEDEKRFQNLKQLCELVDDLLLDIARVAQFKDNQAYSLKRAGQAAYEFIDGIFK